MFHERQPRNLPRWIPFALETQVEGEHLRYRTLRAGQWREHALQDIHQARVVPAQQWSWPVSVNLGTHGSRVVSTSGQAVLIQFNNGQQLLLGSGRPEELLKALRQN